jgi:hypothetical protein
MTTYDLLVGIRVWEEHIVFIFRAEGGESMFPRCVATHLQVAWRHNPEDCFQHLLCCENLISLSVVSHVGP